MASSVILFGIVNNSIHESRGEPRPDTEWSTAGESAGVALSMVLPGGQLRGLANGLRGASAGLTGLFAAGSVRGGSIIGIRQTLLNNGFTQGVSRNGQGYLFRNSLGEEVRIMSRGGGWDIRIRNAAGNYLNEFGGVAGSRAGSHGIGVISR